MIWLMEGLSSQRGLLEALRSAIMTQKWCNPQGAPLQLMASHREFRPEITGVADVSLREPADKMQKLAFILDNIARYCVTLIHVGRADVWFEKHRAQIEATGVKLITGALSVESLLLADDKYRFSLQLAQNSIAHTPACLVESLPALGRHSRASNLISPSCVLNLIRVFMAAVTGAWMTMHPQI